MVRTEVERLRARIQAEAPFVGHVPGEPTGWTELDQNLGGGLPRGAWTILTGPRGGGRSTVAARVLAGRAGPGRPVAWVDGTGDLHPPGLSQQGILLDRLLLVRCRTRASLSAFEQILSSGLFGAVVASGLEPWIEPATLRRLQSAVEAGGAMALWIWEPEGADRPTGAALRLRVQRKPDPHAGSAAPLALEVEKDRSGRAVGRKFYLSVGPSFPRGTAFDSRRWPNAHDLRIPDAGPCDVASAP